MATRSRGPSAGFDWLNRGIGVGFRHPKPLFGGAALVMLVALIPVIVILFAQFQALHAGTPRQPAAFGWISVLPMLVGLLLLPLYAGYLQVIDAAENGLNAHAGDVIKPYREGKALRLIGYGVVAMTIYVALLAIVTIVTGGGFVHWYAQTLTAQANHMAPPTVLPNGFGITLSLIMVVAIFTSGFYAIGIGQVTFNNRGVFGAIGDGLIGALKNLLPLFMLALALILVWIAAAVCIGIVFFLLMLIGKLVGVWLTIVLVVPLYIALILTIFTTMLGVMYYLWRDVCGDDIAPSVAEAVVA